MNYYDDLVYILGDVAMRHPVTKLIPYISGLHVRKVLLREIAVLVSDSPAKRSEKFLQKIATGRQSKDG